mmetsp:Transcript_2521/g.3959  ORF Transcript_2521/g.3959 Transcript_2521/m.3959 type:complete len:241 (+) Transcript_2521:18-740(+)
MSLVFLALFALEAQSSTFPCVFTMPDGEVVNLSSTYSSMPDYEADAMDFIYRLNICGNTLKTCGDQEGIATQWLYNGRCVAVLARQGPKAPQAEYLDPTDPSAGIKLTYFNGDRCNNKQDRMITYKFHCSQEPTRVGLAQEGHICKYEFDIYTKEICPAKTKLKTKTSTSSKVKTGLLLLGGGFIAYFIIGVLANKRKEPQLGVMEAIPNKDFWFDLPSVLYSALKKTLDSCRGLAGGNY